MQRFLFKEIFRKQKFLNQNKKIMKLFYFIKYQIVTFFIVK